jgi:hypothetical protein
MHWSTQSPSVSVIQSRAQPSYARREPSRKVLRGKSRITIFAELADQLAEVRGHIWLYAKKAPQTFPYLSANGLIMLCVNVQFTHVSTPMPRVCPSCVYNLLSWVPRSILSAISLDRGRPKNAGADQRNDQLTRPSNSSSRQFRAGQAAALNMTTSFHRIGSMPGEACGSQEETVSADGLRSGHRTIPRQEPTGPPNRLERFDEPGHALPLTLY